jgi:cell division protein FtsN
VVIFSCWALQDQVFRIISGKPKKVSSKIIKPTPLIKEIPRDELRITAPPEQEQAQKQKVSPLPSRQKPLSGNPASEAETTPVIKKETDTTHTPDRPTFSVQVGAFQVKANAKNLLAELAQKGYNPIIVNIIDYRNNLWHTVRIRENAAPEDAYQAASDYRDREGKPAIVTKTGSLDPVSP